MIRPCQYVYEKSVGPVGEIMTVGQCLIQTGVWGCKPPIGSRAGFWWGYRVEAPIISEDLAFCTTKSNKIVSIFEFLGRLQKHLERWVPYRSKLKITVALIWILLCINKTFLLQAPFNRCQAALKWIICDGLNFPGTLLHLRELHYITDFSDRSNCFDILICWFWEDIVTKVCNMGMLGTGSRSCLENKCINSIGLGFLRAWKSEEGGEGCFPPALVKVDPDKLSQWNLAGW